MDNIKHPKRKKDKYNPYTLQIIDSKYILSFVDVEGHKQSLEIAEDLYQIFNKFELEDISQINKLNRYNEQSELSDNTLQNRLFNNPESVEQIVEKRLITRMINRAIEELPPIQKKKTYSTLLLWINF